MVVFSTSAVDFARLSGAEDCSINQPAGLRLHPMPTRSLRSEVLGGILAVGMFFVAPGAALAQIQEEEELTPITTLEITDLDLGDLLRTPVVESATRRRQSLYEAPGAMDVFSGNEIVNAGVTSIAELLRRIPGAYVMQVNAGRFNVGLRGGNSLANNRVLVLVNGRRLSELDHGSPSWQNMPIHVGEIERVEVLRGPGTTLYGADGINGVINITTKHPLDHAGIEGLFAAGETWLPDQPYDLRGPKVENIGNGYASYAWVSKTSKLGLGFNAGWNHTPDWVASDASAIQLHGDFGYHVGMALDWRPDPNTSLFVDFRHAESEGLRGASDSLTTDRLFDYSREQALTVSFRKDQLLPNVSLSLNADGRRAIEETKLNMQPRGFGLTDASSQQTVLIQVDPENYRGHAVAQLDARLFGSREVVSLASESSYQRSYRLFGATYSELYYAGVLQSETVLLRRPRLLLNLGLRAEQVDLDVGGKGRVRYGNYSPRASLIARLTDAHALRMTWATAYRTPSIWEVSDLSAGVSFYPAPVPQNYVMISNLSLRPEEVQSWELGYRGRPWRWLRADVAIYYQNLRRSIQFLQARMPLVYENGPTRNQAGVEVGVMLRPLTILGAHLSYSATRTTEAGTGHVLHDFPTHLVQVGGEIAKWGGHLTVDLNYISSTQFSLMQAESNGIFDNQVRTSAQALLNLRIGKDILDGAAEIFASGTNMLAFFRERADLVQFPSATADPIGAIVLLGIRVRGAAVGGGP
jgi:outer membrane receptor protein involved in Fe transport